MPARNARAAIFAECRCGVSELVCLKNWSCVSRALKRRMPDMQTDYGKQKLSFFVVWRLS